MPSPSLRRDFFGAALRCAMLCVFFFPACGPAQQPEPEPAKPVAGPAKHSNHLVGESSPYLLKHAHNPVDWRPWGEEALALAKKENKPIFLSIGYSSCYWCHVMERESFEDEEIAKILNEHFICIKVDREERPDIDKIYMTSLQVFNRLSRSGGGAGWPLSMFLTPDAKPFFGGSYFPARDGDRGAGAGFLTIAKKIHELWTDTPKKLASDGEIIAKATKAELESSRPAVLNPPSAQTLIAGLEGLAESYDPKYGGFQYSPTDPRRPKFPEVSNIIFLLGRAQAWSSDADPKQQERAKQALAMAQNTLDHILQGGIRDHLGGGFHRYSVDRWWRIPHFEKMLYDNGQLATAFVQAYQITKEERYSRAARELLDFVLREMKAPHGGFYAALDAESEAIEGKFYRWTKEELEKALTPEEFTLFSSVYGIDKAPNFEEEFYAPQFDRSLALIAADHNTTEAALAAKLAPINAKLLVLRNRRVRPLTDTKILTGWNGLMIGGLADAGRILKEPRYTSAAAEAAQFVLTELRTQEGRLLRTYAAKEAKLNAYLNDYVFLVDGLLALHEATGDKRWLETADELTELQLDLFADDKLGGFFLPPTIMNPCSREQKESTTAPFLLGRRSP